MSYNQVWILFRNFLLFDFHGGLNSCHVGMVFIFYFFFLSTQNVKIYLYLDLLQNQIIQVYSHFICPLLYFYNFINFAFFFNVYSIFYIILN